MIADLLASAITFKKCTLEKLAFIALNLIDMGLTLLAASQGAHELNPIMRNMVSAPAQIFLVKAVFPILFAWALPGKILIPSIAVLVFVVGWDVRELLRYVVL
jgi:hypothetical protein